jgi:hypothetical protein
MDTLIPVIGLCCIGIFALGFGGGGVFLIYFTRKNQQKADASQGWPATTGTIIDADVSRSMHEDSDGDNHYSYSPHVRYTYQVIGSEFTGDKITFGFGKGYGSEAKAQQALANYPVGKQVTVYYDPENPASAVLERKAGGSVIGYILGGIFILVGVCMACPLLFTIPAMLSGLTGTGQ